MDFLKVLMLYMSLTFAAGVDAAAVPTPTPPPTPSPTPTAVVTTFVPETPEVTVTPVPTETPVPRPTITPNRAYINLAFGSRGAEVKKLQQRLAELGYLTGNIDGAYGYQTKNAVTLFQRLNGLTADGVAGRATQTMLFEDPEVLPNPERVTPSPEPTATPDAQGIIPLEENPLTVWKQVDAEVLLNGQPSAVPMGVWQRGSELIFDLNDLCAAGKWAAEGKDAAALTASIEGTELSAEVGQTPAARMDDAGNMIHCESYDVTVDGERVECLQGDLVFYEGNWYISKSLLKNVFNASVVYDEEEGVVLLQVTSRELSGSEG